MCIFVFLTCYSFNGDILTGYSCEYLECTCVDDMITCVEVQVQSYSVHAVYG